MDAPTADVPARRSGPETRAAILGVALELFTTQGYAETSMRQIADALGIQKASLYYHFAGKEQIVRSLFDQRGDEAETLLQWIASQPPSVGLAKAAVLRWVDSFSADKLRGIRFLAANPLITGMIGAGDDDRIGSALTDAVEALAGLLPCQTAVDVLQLRMALLSINAAVEAAAQDGFSDEDVLATAHHAAATLMNDLMSRS
jgi:AcrR family transcriptional regulator